MATDAKIDKLIASIEKLVATMDQETGDKGNKPSRRKSKESTDTTDDARRQALIIEAEKERNRLIEERKKVQENISLLEEEIREGLRTDAAFTRQAQVAQEIALEDAEEELVLLEKKVQAQHEALDLLKKQELAQESIKETTLDVLSATFGIHRGLADSFIEAGGIKGQMKGIGAAAKEIFSPGKGLLNLGLNIMRSFVFNTGKAVLQFDAAAASLNSMSGAAGELNGLVSDTAIESNAFGVSFEDSAQAVGGLISSVTNFRQLSSESQKEITKFTARMGKLGVSAETVGASFDTLTDGLRMLPQEAIAVQEEMMATAVALKIPPQEMAEGFSQALPYLSSFGKDAPKIFTKVSAAARKLSVSTETLIEMTKQFDTFEGAAQSAGQLNAVLGGSMLNSYDLLNAKTDERIKMVLSAVDANGKEWSSMHRFEQMAIANAAGIQDMAEANKIFGGGLSAFEDAESALENLVVTEEQLADAQKASLSLTNKLTGVWNMFTVAVKPITEFLAGILDLVMRFNTNFPRLSKVLLIVIGAFATLIGAMLSLKTIALPVQVAFGGLAAVLPATGASAAAAGSSIAAGATAAAGGITAVGSAAAATAPGLFTLGATIALIGVGIAIAAYGLAQFVMAFNGMEPAQILAVSVALLVFLGSMVAMILILTKISPATAIAAASMLALGGAFLMIGVGIALVAVGIGYMVQNISGLESAIEPVLSAVATLAMAFGALMLAVANPLSLIGFAALAGSIATIAFALRAIPEDKSLAFSNVMDSVVKYSNVTEEPNIENVEKMIELAGDYQEVQSEMKLPALDSFVQALKGVFGADKDSTSSGSSSSGNTMMSGASSSGNTEIVLKLNDREMGRAVFEIMGDKMKNVVLERG
jgi:hypothetical protein